MGRPTTNNRLKILQVPFYLCLIEHTFVRHKPGRCQVCLTPILQVPLVSLFELRCTGSSCRVHLQMCMYGDMTPVPAEARWVSTVPQPSYNTMQQAYLCHLKLNWQYAEHCSAYLHFGLARPASIGCNFMLASMPGSSCSLCCIVCRGSTVDICCKCFHVVCARAWSMFTAVTINKPCSVQDLLCLTIISLTTPHLVSCP